MKVKTVTDLNELLREMEEMAVDDGKNSYVFRGHQSPDWKLQSTFDRFSNTRLPELRAHAFDYLINDFSHRLSQLGDNRLIDETRRGKLEYARHCGVPSPLIDFTRSPYVALWFAFNGVRGTRTPEDHVALLALDWNKMGVGFQRLCEEFGWEDGIRNIYGRPSLTFLDGSKPTSLKMDTEKF